MLPKIESLYSQSVLFFKEKVIASLDTQQKKILAVVTLALGLLALGYVVKKCCFKAKVPEKVEKRTLPNGAVLEGVFKNDLLNGKGTVIDHHGTTWVGTFKDGLPEGHVSFKRADGRTGEGDYKNGKLNGNGRIDLLNGGTAEGEFKDDELNGKGTLKLADGTVFAGIFKNNQPVEEGTVTQADGTAPIKA